MDTFIFGCTGKKRPGAHRALDLYMPRQFKIARELAASGCRVMILSAKHGLIDGGDVIESYEQPMTDPRADDLAAAIPSNYPTSGNVFVYGGATYRGIVRAWARHLDASAPFEIVGRNRGNGDHYSALVDLARSMG